MKRLFLFGLILLIFEICFAQTEESKTFQKLKQNKEIAKNFYQDLWATNNTDKYKDYVADEYVVHDIGDRKNVTEPAIEQKNVADMFWNNGSNQVTIDYQIAEGDLVATRWLMKYEPKTLFGKILFGSGTLPIINVFRIKDGKIVEFWNHRHDIDTNQTLRFTLKGLLIGLLIALIPTIWAFRLRKKLKRQTNV
ncbi:nuclear transport factor 2 family protein [Galbibacter mesophilus]|uniref:nuclear transport factor 2 family protein n=1 Tax=Galbibacter mesophilus TaxID=379069 RepID=UPI00191DB57B|nr:ester cyclase [Galbibacter mesophilus]MCM5661537.1 ester cyclase [Galbibacter mesophilus]